MKPASHFDVETDFVIFKGEYRMLVERVHAGMEVRMESSHSTGVSKRSVRCIGHRGGQDV